MKTGIELITDERQRQIKEEKFGSGHDDAHTDGSLADAALCYIARCRVFFLEKGDDLEFVDPWPPEWAGQWDKRYEYGQRAMGRLPNPKTYTHLQRIDLLTKGGALIAAEIDRLQRAEVKKANG